jgi:PAS domain S-box-containing protein
MATNAFAVPPPPGGARADSAQDYRRLFQAGPTPLIVVDHASLAILAVNQAATRAYGYSEPEFLDGSFADFVGPEDRTALLRLPDPAPVPGLLEARSAWDIVGRDGTRRRAEVAGAAVTFTGRPCAILYQPPEAEPGAADVGRTGASLPEFSFSALHDLKEPLHLVRGYLSLLRDRAGGHLDAEASEYLDAAHAGAQRMQSIVLSLLEYFRVDAKGIAPEPVDLRVALDDALAGLRLQVDEAGATVTADDLPRVLADRPQVGRLLQNLLSNALKFRRPGTAPRIQLAARRDGDRWEVTVRDNGIGIDPKDQERILQPFQRVHSNDAYPGTGLGLSISRRIVEMHGGHLWIESAPGEGTTIHFTLPAEAA